VSRALRKRDELLDGLKLAGRRVSTATIMFHQAVADRLGLNLTDHKCVDLLLLNGPLTAGELASLTALTTGAITAALDRLERAGFVTREDDPRDRRRVVVRPVPRRVAAIGRLFESVSARLDELAACYTPEELELLVDFMNRNCDAVHESTLELRRGATATGKKPARRARDKG
jgi:DNA-binding MarR family transcriptional regulator